SFRPAPIMDTDATAGRVLCQSEVATTWRDTVLVSGCSVAPSEYCRRFARWIGCDEGRTGAGSGRTGYNVLMMLHGGWIIIYGSLRRLFFFPSLLYIYRVGQDGVAFG